MAGKRERKKLKRVNAWVVIIAVLAFVALVGGIAWSQLHTYEEGVLDVYAVQQDGYVQLVLDQINLQENRENEEIVQNILGTLDASSNRYWTLSETDSLVFVKDVLETNRYKGFTTETYYTSKSAESFIHNLEDDRVTHSMISINDRTYVASGVRFSYNGKTYHMCLLTGEDAVLDQNTYLSAKVSLILLVMLALAVVICGGVVLAMLAEKWYQKYSSTEQENLMLTATIEKLNHERTKDMLFHTRYTAFDRKALPTLLEKMEQKAVWPLEMLIVRCEEGNKRQSFMGSIQIYLDRKTIRVILDDTYIALLTMQSECRTMSEAGEMIHDMGGELVARKQLEERPQQYLEAEFSELWKGVTDDGQ